MVLGFLITSGLRDDGKPEESAGWLAAITLSFATYSLLRILRRRRLAPLEEQPLYQTLTLAAAATLAAVLIGALQPLWLYNDQFVPANLLPGVVFAVAMARLVFRLRAMEVRLVARRTLQYLLARWTLGTLFLVPALILVFGLGQRSASGREAPGGEVLAYLVWMILAGVLLSRRHLVLRNLDRRFFRDAEQTRQQLVELAAELGGQPDSEAVLGMLESGVKRALHPLWLRFSLPDVGPSPEAVLSLSLSRREHDFGYLNLGPREADQAYGGEERRLLEAACAQASLALENARLSAALLAQQRAELSSRTAGVLAGAEEERRRLAADLHDQVLPELRQIAAEVDRIIPAADGIAPDLQAVGAEVRGTMDSVREVMEALRPSALDMLGLSDALESYLRKGAARCKPSIAVSVRRTGEEPTLNQEQSLALYRICQEALNNVFKHSEATRAGLEVSHDAGGVTLAVWDDGRGVDPSAAAGKGHGLGNMRSRAELIGAEVSWTSLSEGGTRFEVRLRQGLPRPSESSAAHSAEKP
jgi:signal transduction histidine kinase